MQQLSSAGPQAVVGLSLLLLLLPRAEHSLGAGAASCSSAQPAPLSLHPGAVSLQHQGGCPLRWPLPQLQSAPSACVSTLINSSRRNMEKPGLEPPPPAFPNKGLIEAGPAQSPGLLVPRWGQKSRGHRVCTGQDGSSLCRAPRCPLQLQDGVPCPQAAWWAHLGTE